MTVPCIDNLGAQPPKYFLVLDMASGYWQFESDEESQQKTAFTTSDGLTYAWRVMPMGAKNSGFTSQRAMTQILAGLHWKFLLMYMDDMIFFSE